MSLHVILLIRQTLGLLHGWYLYYYVSDLICKYSVHQQWRRISVHRWALSWVGGVGEVFIQFLVINNNFLTGRVAGLCSM